MSGSDRSLRRIVLGVALFAAVALAAPLIALDVPFFARVSAGAATRGVGALPAGTSFPWLPALFDVRTFASAVDRACNAALLLGIVFVPCVVGAWRRGRPLVRWLALWVVAAFAMALALERSLPSRAWVDKIDSARAAGEDATAWFPVVRCSPAATDMQHAREGLSAAHLLGTDSTGRDVFARVLFGARTSLATGLLATSLALLVGVVLGALAGSLRGFADVIVLRLVEVTACFPGFLLVMTWIALAGHSSLYTIMTLLGLTGWTTIARLVRAEFLRQADLEYRVAATALGAPWWRILAVHLLPNAWSPVLVAAAFFVSGAILAESGLAFLNLGDPTVASWGELLRQGRESGRLHLILAPGLLIFLTVTMMNRLASVLRDRLDPRRSEGAA